MREILARTFAALRDILQAHGGTVEKFIGDAVMAVFGVPAAHEDDADRAVRAAFAVREAVHKQRGGSAGGLEIRAGIATGEVVAGGGGGSGGSGDFLVTGPPAYAAARLQQAAQPGEILIAPQTRDLTRGSVRTGERRVVEAKGFGTLECYPAEGLFSALPEHRAGVPGLTAPLIGRDEELRLLTTTYERVVSERRAYLTTIFGTAGLGKSRLARQWSVAADDRTVRWGRCLPYGEGITFWPMREILFSDAGIDPADTQNDVVAKIRTAVFSAFGDNGDDADEVAKRLTVVVGSVGADVALPEVHATNVGQELRWAVRRYFERRAAREPIVLIFEDIHWAEPALLDLVDYLAEWARAPIFLLCLARPELLDGRPTWGGGKTNAASLALEPLSGPETRRLIGELLPSAKLPRELVNDLVARADGNPLYVEEFLRMLIDTARISYVDGQWFAQRALPAAAIPPTVHGLIAARLDRVPQETKTMLRTAAIVGKVFWTSALAALTDTPPAEATLLDAARRGIVVELDEPGLRGGRAFAFRHILIRDVAYGEVVKTERFRLHDTFARWLEECCGDRIGEYAEIVAFHAEQAFHLARELGSLRVDELGHRAFERLLGAATRARRRADLHAALGLYERAAHIGDAIALATPERAEAEGFAALSRYYIEGTPEALDRLDRAIDAVRAAGPSEVLVRLLSQRGFIARTDVKEAARFFQEGIAAAKATDDPHLIAHALLMSNAEGWMRGDLAAHEQVLREAYAYMKRSEVHAELGVCLVWLASNALQMGDFGSMLRYLDEAEEVAAASGSKFQLWAARRAAAREALAIGDNGRAMHLANDALALATEVGARRLIGLAFARLGDALYEAGEFAQSRTILEQGLAMIDPYTMREAYAEIQWKLARACLASGDSKAARTHAAAGLGASSGDLYSHATTSAALAAVCAADGDYPDAERLFQSALNALQKTGYGALRADVAREYARFLIDRGRGREARPLLEAGRSFYADPLADRRRAEIDALLARCAAAEAGAPIPA